MEEDDRDEPPAKPPGQFMEDAHEADTKRFVEQARELARRRTESPRPGTKRKKASPPSATKTRQ